MMLTEMQVEQLDELAALSGKSRAGALRVVLDFGLSGALQGARRDRERADARDLSALAALSQDGDGDIGRVGALTERLIADGIPLADVAEAQGSTADELRGLRERLAKSGIERQPAESATLEALRDAKEFVCANVAERDRRVRLAVEAGVPLEDIGVALGLDRERDGDDFDLVVDLVVERATGRKAARPTRGKQH